jgi:hypothetical protein
VSRTDYFFDMAREGAHMRELEDQDQRKQLFLKQVDSLKRLTREELETYRVITTTHEWTDFVRDPVEFFQAAPFIRQNILWRMIETNISKKG